MSGKIILLAIVFLCSAGQAYSQNDEILDWDGSTSWHNYLINQMHEQYNDYAERIEQMLTSSYEIEAYQRELQYRNNQISYIGKPVVGQRVQDILTLLDFISRDVRISGDKIAVYAQGYTASQALHTAVLDNRVNQLHLSDTIRSYMELLENLTMKNGYAVPNALKYYNLPDLVDLVKP